MLGECCIVSANVKHWTAGSLERPFPMCISQTIEKEKLRGRETDTGEDQGEIRNAQRHHVSQEQRNTEQKHSGKKVAFSL